MLTSQYDLRHRRLNSPIIVYAYDGGVEAGGKVEVTWRRLPEAAVLLLRGRTARTAAPVSLVVGTVLSAVNQGNVIASGAATDQTWIRVGVNYVVPYLVASVGFLAGRRAAE
jgi:hypothetical protein